jgi:hypothetical protein
LEKRSRAARLLLPIFGAEKDENESRMDRFGVIDPIFGAEKVENESRMDLF